MAIKQYAVDSIIKLLKTAARRKSVVTYAELWKIFDRVDSEGDQWDTLAEAVKRICSPVDAIYGAVMSAKGNGLPGNGFYKLFQQERLSEYERLFANVDVQDLSEAQKKTLTDTERLNVYAHAEESS